MYEYNIINISVKVLTVAAIRYTYTKVPGYRFISYIYYTSKIKVIGYSTVYGIGYKEECVQ